MNLTYNDYFTTSGHGSSYELDIINSTRAAGSYYEEAIVPQIIMKNLNTMFMLCSVESR